MYYSEIKSTILLYLCFNKMPTLSECVCSEKETEMAGLWECVTQEHLFPAVKALTHWEWKI